MSPAANAAAPRRRMRTRGGQSLSSVPVSVTERASVPGRVPVPEPAYIPDRDRVAPKLSAYAACRDYPDLAWDTTASAGIRVDEAKAVCGTCPVEDGCLAYALTDPSLSGVWGGTSTSERRDLRKMRAAPVLPAPGPQVPRPAAPASAGAPRGATAARGSGLPPGRAVPRPYPQRPEIATAHLEATVMPASRSDGSATRDPASRLIAPRPRDQVRPGVPAREPDRPNGPGQPAAGGPAAADKRGDRGERMRVSRAVTAYLDMIAGEPPKPRKNARTVESEIAKIDQRLDAGGLTSARRLRLIQDKRDLHTRGVAGGSSKQALRDGFIACATSYAREHGISYEAFIDFGVPPDVLDRAGLRPAGEQSPAADADGG